MKHPKLGEILIRLGAIDELQLNAALAHQRQWGTPLGKTLVEKRFCTVDALMSALSEQTGLAVMDLDQEYLDEKLAPLLSRKAAEQHRVVPLRTEGKREEILVVAIAAPASLTSIDAVQKVTGKLRVRALLASDAAIDRALGRIYGGYARAETRSVDPKGFETVPLQEEEFDFEAIAVPAKPRPVLIYGWAEESAKNLALTLASQGVPARMAGAFEVMKASPSDTVIAPLAAIEVLTGSRSRLPAQLIVLGKDPDADFARAARVGAKGFLTLPLDVGLLVRAVQRSRTAAPLPLIA